MSDQPQDQQQETKQETPSEFAAVLLQHAKGRAHDEATAALKDAVDAVRRLGKPAAVTVQLTIHPVENNRDVVRIQDKVTSTIPREKRASMWFPDAEGGLHRNDPNQHELDFHHN